MFLRKTLAPAAAGVVLLATALAFAPAAPVVAQEVVQDEGAAYRAWHDASQAADGAKAMAAAKAYIEQYPTGQYADFMKKWYGTAQMTALDAAIKEKRTGDMIAVGREILATDLENLNVLYALAFNIRRNELFASPPADELEAGSCFVNTFVRSDPRLPFGGTREGGYGRELGRHGLLEFQNEKTVYVR